MQGIIRTCKKAPTEELYKFIYNSFPLLVDYSYRHGMRYVPDDFYINTLGFSPDIDGYGKEVIKRQGITQENQQHSTYHRAPDLKHVV